MSAKESIASTVGSVYKTKINENLSYLSHIIQMIMWLCRQGLPLRGHIENQESKNQGKQGAWFYLL
jgi:hypothetical protein